MPETVLPRDPSPSAPAFDSVRHFRARAAKLQALRLWLASLSPALRLWLASLSPALCLWFASFSPSGVARAREQHNTPPGVLAAETKRGAPHRGHRKQSPPFAADCALRQSFTGLRYSLYLGAAVSADWAAPPCVSIACSPRRHRGMRCEILTRLA
jgi:hypothetical protein